MKILVLNGSPRPQGDTAKMVAVFREAAKSAGHDVAVINVCRKTSRAALPVNIAMGKGTAYVFKRTTCRRSMLS